MFSRKLPRPALLITNPATFADPVSIQDHTLQVRCRHSASVKVTTMQSIWKLQLQYTEYGVLARLSTLCRKIFLIL